jgi:hypothetical protein
MYCLHLQESHISLKRHGFVTQEAVDLDSLRVSENRLRRRIYGPKSQERNDDEKILHHYCDSQIKEMGVKRKILEQDASSKLS